MTFGEAQQNQPALPNALEWTEISSSTKDSDNQAFLTNEWAYAYIFIIL